MSKTLSQIKAHNRRVGQHFFDRGNQPILSKQGDYLVTKSFGGGFVVYKYNPKNGHIDHVNNPTGEYSWKPYDTKAQAVAYAKKLANR